MGELVIDDTEDDIECLYLDPPVHAEVEVLEAIRTADAIILSAGSFMTSIMPALLVDNIKQAINLSSAPLILVANMKPELLGGNKTLSLMQQLTLLRTSGVRSVDEILWPSSRQKEVVVMPKKMTLPVTSIHDMDGDIPTQHDSEKLRQAVLSAMAGVIVRF